MKIAIPVDQNTMDTNVCVSFGRAPFFLIYDTQSEAVVFLNNSAAASSGGAGIKAAQVIVDHRVEALLTPRCGENAAEVIKAGGIKLYKTEGTSAQDNISAYVKGRLSLLEEIHPGFHGHGGQ